MPFNLFNTMSPWHFCDDYIPSDKHPGIVFTLEIQRTVFFLINSFNIFFQIIFGIHVIII